jgi:multiple antibiotic resistance protein
MKYHVHDLLLLLIGLGPKIALVPFLDLTKEMDVETQKKVTNRMLRTALVTVLILAVLMHFPAHW